MNYPDGRFAAQFEGTPLPFRVFDKIQTVQPGEIVENKRMGTASALVKEQAAYEPIVVCATPHGNDYRTIWSAGSAVEDRPRRGGMAAPPG